MLDLDKKLNQYIVLFLLAFVWGGSFILMKKGLESFDYMQVAALRIFFTFVMLLPFAIKRVKRVKKEHIKSLIIVAIIGNGLPSFMFTIAQTEISSSLAGILNSTTPIFTLIVGFFFYKTKVKAISIVGIFIGLVGTLGLILQGNSNIFTGNNWYAIFVIIASLFYAINLNEIKKFLQGLDALTITSVAFLFTGPLAGIYLLFTDVSDRIIEPKAIENLGYIFILALFSSVIAVTVFNVLVKKVRTLFSSSVTYVIPIFAIMWGLLDGEIVSIAQILWMIVILSGVYLVNYSKKSTL